MKGLGDEPDSKGLGEDLRDGETAKLAGADLYRALIGQLFGSLSIIAAILGLIEAGLIRVTATDTGMIAVLLISAVVVSLAMFVLGVRLCVYFFFAMGALLFSGLRAMGKPLAEKKADGSGFRIDLRPKTSGAEKEDTEALMASSQHEPEAELTLGERLRERLLAAAGSVLMWLFIPRWFRHRRGWIID